MTSPSAEAESTGSESTGSKSTEIELPPWLRIDELLRYWGRDPRSLNERVEGHRLSWALRFGEGDEGVPEGEPALLTASIEGRTARLSLYPTPHPATGPHPAPERALGLFRRLVGLHLDPTDFEQRILAGPESQRDPLARHVALRPGLTVPQTSTVFDGVVWVIAGQQVSLPVAFSIRRRLSLAHGRIIGGRPTEEPPTEEPLRVPPSARTLAAAYGDAAEDALFDHGLSRRKAEYLGDIARAVQGGELDLEGLRQMPESKVEEILLARRGLGPWSVNYLRMRSLGHADCVPVGDAALKKALQRLHGLDQRPGPEQTQELMAPYAPFRSLATFHLWASLRDEL